MGTDEPFRPISIEYRNQNCRGRRYGWPGVVGGSQGCGRLKQRDVGTASACWIVSETRATAALPGHLTTTPGTSRFDRPVSPAVDAQSAYGAQGTPYEEQQHQQMGQRPHCARIPLKPRTPPSSSSGEFCYAFCRLTSAANSASITSTRSRLPRSVIRPAQAARVRSHA